MIDLFVYKIELWYSSEENLEIGLLLLVEI